MIAVLLVSSYLLITFALEIPYCQRMVSSCVSSYLSQRLGTEVFIERIDIGLFNRIIINNFRIKDKKGQQLFKCQKFSACIKMRTLFQKKITIRTCKLSNAQMNLIQESKDGPYNFQFILDSLTSSSDKTSKETSFQLNSLIVHNLSISHDQTYLPRLEKGFDAHHCKIYNLSANLKIDLINKENIDVHIRKIKAQEKSGLDLKKVELHFLKKGKDISISNISLLLNHSEFYSNYIQIHQQDTIKGHHKKWLVKSSPFNLKLIPADLRPFFPQLSLPAKSYLAKGSIILSPDILNIPYIRIEGNGNLKMEGQLSMNRTTEHRKLVCDIKKLHLNSEDFKLLTQNLFHKQPKVTSILKRLGDIKGDGFIKWGKDINKTCKVSLKTDIGGVQIGARGIGKHYEATLSSKDLDIGQLINNKKLLGVVPFTIHTKFNLTPKDKVSNAIADIVINNGEIKQYAYHNIQSHIDYSAPSSTINYAITIADPNAQIRANGNFHTKHQQLSFNGDIETLNPSKIKLSKEIFNYPISGRITLSTNLKDKALNGGLSIQNLTFKDPEKNYTIQKIDLSKKNFKNQTHLKLESDFVQAEIQGKFMPLTLVQSLSYIIRKNTIGNQTLRTNNHHNQFSFNLRLQETDFFKNIIKKDFSNKGELFLSGYIDDKSNELLIEGRAPAIEMNGGKYHDVRIYCNGKENKMDLLLQLYKELANSNVYFMAEAHNQDKKLKSDIVWKSDADIKNFGKFSAQTQFLSEKCSQTQIYPTEIVIEDSLWQVAPSMIYTDDKYIGINNFKLYRGDKHLIVNGHLTSSKQDSLNIDINKINLEYVFDLLNFHPVEFTGIATGTGVITDLFKKPNAEASLYVEKFHFNKGYMGDMHLKGGWNGNEHIVNLSASIQDSLNHHTQIDGQVAVAKKGLDLHFDADSTNMEFLNYFMPDALSDISGTYKGNCRLHGTFDELILEGEGIANMKMKIVPLNTVFYLPQDSIYIRPNHVIIPQINITDPEGRKGLISGNIYHNHFHDFKYNFRFLPQGMLTYNTTANNGLPFWGKVYSTGDIRISGHPGAFNANINIQPEMHSVFTYNADQTENAEENNILTFHDKEKRNGQSSTPDDNEHQNVKKEEDEQETDVRLNFSVNMNPNITLNVITDGTSGNQLSITGNGLLRASYYNKGKFEMYGNYELDGGSYDMTIQNFIRKKFQFNKGSKISFNGDPNNGDLNLQAAYTINSASLGDLNFGSTFSNKNVKVNCLLNFTGKVGMPQIHFDMDIPNINDEEKQMIKSLISSEEDMNLQTLYLLSVGRFYTYDYTRQTSTQSQSSSAVNSILSGTLSSQLNTILSNAFKNEHWTLGTNFQTGNDGWNDMEIEGIFSGRFLSGHLLLGGSLGYREKQLYNKTNVIGDFNIEYLLNKNGTIRLKAYSEENDRYFTKSSLTTQGGGIRFQKEFNHFSDLFKKKSHKNKSKKIHKDKENQKRVETPIINFK